MICNSFEIICLWRIICPKGAIFPVIGHNYFGIHNQKWFAPVKYLSEHSFEWLRVAFDILPTRKPGFSRPIEASYRWVIYVTHRRCCFCLFVPHVKTCDVTKVSSSRIFVSPLTWSSCLRISFLVEVTRLGVNCQGFSLTFLKY